MDFDFTTETITPDSTSILTIGGTGALEVPAGSTAQQPGGAIGGALRYNTDTARFEGFFASAWANIGSVSSVSTTQPAAGLTITGGPITSSGTFVFSLANDLAAVEGLATNGIAVRTATDAWTTRTIAGTGGTIVVTNGDGIAGNPTITLATAGTPVTASFVKITTDTFGRVTATTPVVTADITALVDATYVNVTGDSMSGNLTMTGGATVTGLPTPTGGTDAANKNYVDALVTGLSWKQAVLAATTANITLSAPQTIDGIAVVAGNRVLVKNQTTSSQNGIYVVAAGAWTRALDADSATELDGLGVYVQQGTANGDTGWTETATVTTVGTDPVVFAQFSGSGSYTAGTGLTLTGNTFSLTSPVSPTLGGTGTTTAPTSGQVLVGTAGGVYAPATIGVTTGISITAGSGTLTINNTGVTSIAGTAGNITASAATGAVTLNLATAGTAGTYGVVTTDAFGRVTSGSVITPVANGGTGLSALGTANQVLGVNAAGTAAEYKTIAAGTGISVTPTVGNLTIANTGVLSFTQTVPAYMTITGAATATGAVTSAISFNSQTAGFVFAAPSGAAGVPTFRALVPGDVLKLYTENPSTPTAPTAAGTNAVAIGSGSSAAAANSLSVGAGSASTLAGSVNVANGSFATAGDAQAIKVIARNITTNATPTNLFLDGGTAPLRLVLPNNSAWLFTLSVIGRRTDAVGGIGGFTFTGVIIRDANAASTALSGIPSKVTVQKTNATWNAVVSADATNGALQIQVTGEAAKTIRWVATCELTQVTN